jgi:hypothetical protein
MKSNAAAAEIKPISTNIKLQEYTVDSFFFKKKKKKKKKTLASCIRAPFMQPRDIWQVLHAHLPAHHLSIL